ncbi:hypothetical protein CANTEDRAFT_112697 [Yamadazyma tenuis ATCC 10573]|uniref:Erg28-domain-containing protein n=1 Tax=Candida tenuis (strain ATCC 10573 / BCRC 21748 / CBS 615 / JCM 9827 / NBRC 10315 / NRRL Y-1498 / VKM Y-70) TaxID=590646 RepID=G3AYE6_CANTC|nr:Erg28-domain-containing protein [Yamadazyma tenuis ATCC 10573]XP_006684775.1 uncharacterized protein CANTEDRAFT_112697 [Yamadazyma tenuis ATCC 10573]EGV66200.1 Erg28-domain-containing protein [Yamadazyma tenuis ATCC 10573]EGV66201.1 hypothetical protein CANTEDRAFT_112697 [Yamadazyma tenuis ATCC 10573]
MFIGLQSILPVSTPNGGYLPHWLFFISVVSIFNSVQAYFSTDLSKKVYSNASPSEISPLGVRTFGTWTFITSIVRLYGSWYLVGNKQIFELCFWSFFVAFTHFNLEWLVYKNCKFDKGLAGPFLVSTISMIWMLSQKDFYLSADISL